MLQTTRKELRVLIVEDNEDDCLLVLRELRRNGFEPVWERVDSYDGMRDALGRSQWDMVISDYVLPKFSGPAALALLRKSGMDLPFLIVSGNIGEDIAVGSMKAGAHDYIIKGNLARLAPAVERELREREVRRDRRRAESALQESQHNLAKAQSIARLGSWSYDLRSEKMTWSDELCRIFGVDPDSCSRDFETILTTAVHPDDREKVLNAYRLMLAESKGQSLEYRILLSDGTSRFVLAESQSVPDASDRPTALIGTVQDITERKRAEEALTRLATAVESAADALVVTDPERGIIQYVNPAFEKITGYRRDEIVGRDLHQLDSGKHDESFYRELRDTLKREGFWSGRLIQKRKDGSLYEEECSYSPVISSTGEIINYISIKRDVTEKARLEAIAQAVDTMNNIGYIFSGVRHEIGNPVNAVRLTLNAMRKKCSSLTGELLAEHLDRLIAEVSKIEYLLDSLKNFNMYENVHVQRVNIRTFLDSFLAIAKKDFAAKGIELETIVDQGVRSLYADPRALQQVLLNVLTNASDALEGRPQPKISLHASRKPGMISIQVKDNGAGIEESRLKDLFKPFYTTKKHGTGLGLVIIKKMLSKMNGTVEISSRAGLGTVVTMSLPEKTEAR